MKMKEKCIGCGAKADIVFHERNYKCERCGRVFTNAEFLEHLEKNKEKKQTITH